MSKPKNHTPVKFDPNQKFESVKTSSENALRSEMKTSKFDPSQKFEAIEEPSMLESGVRGVAQGLSFGFADELTGALESTLSDKTYKQARDESRKAYDEAEKANPITYNVGDIGASIATSFIPGFGALNASKGARLVEVAGKAALQGGLTSAGHSDKEDLAGLAGDTLKGVGAGAVLGSAAHGLGKGVEYLSDNLDDIKGFGDAAIRGFKQGYKSDGFTGSDLLDTAATVVSHGTIPTPFRASRGIKGAIEALKDKGATDKELSEVAEQLRHVWGPGASQNLSKEEVLMRGLLDEGSNPAKDYVASKFGAAGGNVDLYKSLINLSPEETAAARAFNKAEAADSLTQGITDTYRGFSDEASKRYGQLKDAARNAFPQQSTAPVQILSDAIKDANKYQSISGGTKAVLNDVFADLTGREGEKAFTQLTPAEQFDRLLASKQRLGKAVKWAAKNELPEGQQILQQTYGKFQSLLQSLDDMASADTGYKQFKGLENNLFKKLSTTERGTIKEFDAGKIEKLMSDTKEGRKLAKKLIEAKEMLDNGTLSPEVADKMRPFFKSLEESMNKSKLQRDLNSFRQQQGPSSPAIERLQASLGKETPLSQASTIPNTFLKIREDAVKNAEVMFQKPYKELNMKQKELVGKMALWRASPEGQRASPAEMARKISQLLSE
jgi:hypothetical protein